MSQWGINLSGIRWMIENAMYSSLLCSFWKKSLMWLRPLISISIFITPLKNFCVAWKIRKVLIIYSIGQSG